MYTLDLAILSARTAGPYTTGNTRRMPALGWMGAACSRHEPRSHHLAQWASQGRMRAVGATCTAPKTHGRPKRTAAPEYCKIGAAQTQRCRLSGRTASLASHCSQRPIARGFAGRATVLGSRLRPSASPLDIRATKPRVRGPGDRQPQSSARRESSHSVGADSATSSRYPGETAFTHWTRKGRRKVPKLATKRQ